MRLLPGSLMFLLVAAAPGLAAQSPAQAESGCADGSAQSCWIAGVLQERINLPRAAAFYQRACEGSYPEACRALGSMLSEGRGVEPNGPRASVLFQQACDLGLARACTDRGILLQFGRGVDQNLSQALALFRRGCDIGDPQACGNAGLMYRNGEGAIRGPALARTFLQKACDGGIGTRCTVLGLLLETGDEVVTVDLPRAAQAYQRACDLNDARGCARLGGMYQDGRGVREDRNRADALFRRACDIGTDDVCRERARLPVITTP
jgi:TPR repeat protein